jgi:hypothetical protein
MTGFSRSRLLTGLFPKSADDPKAGILPAEHEKPRTVASNSRRTYVWNC